MSATAAGGLIHDLQRLLGEGQVLPASEWAPYEADATASRGLRGRPDAVVLPRDAAQVQGLVQWACRQGVPLVPRGGGTGLAGGAVPVDGGIVVALSRLSEIHELCPEEWRITVGAGVSTATVRRLARENGLFFPPDPSAGELSQIGGNVATNAGGPHAFKYGNTGAWVTGLDAVISPGDIVSLGGQARKDVGGYDIKSLMIGSEGTLGILTAVTLRLLPAPETVLPLVAFYPGTASGAAAVHEVIATGQQAAALDYLDGAALAIVARAYPGSVPQEAGMVVLAEVDGPREEAARQARELRETLAAQALHVEQPALADLWRWRDGVSGAVAAQRGGKVSEDIFVPVARLADAVDAIHAIGEELRMPACTWGHAGDGNIHASLLVDPHDPAELEVANAATARMFALAVQLGGGVTGEHGIGYLKRGQLQRQWSEQAIALHERIKQTFDPAGIMNPGKKVARLPAD